MLQATILTIDSSTATVLVALFVAVSSVWNTYILNKVHTLTNSNFTEAKAARATAEAALKASNDLNVTLQHELDLRSTTI